MSKVRIIVQDVDATEAVNVGGPVHTSFHTFDVEGPELVAHMRSLLPAFGNRTIIGVEVLEQENEHG